VEDHEVAIHKPPGYAELPIEMVFSGGICGRLKWAVGNTYAIQPGRGKKAMGRIRIMAIRRERLQEISCGGYMYRSDIQQEGCPFINDPNQMGWDELEWFIELWDSINVKNGTRWQDNPEVWVLELEDVSV